MKNKEIRLLYLMELFSGLARGAYLVCIGWTTLVISNDVATVGQIFVVSSLAFMLAGPIVGVVIDRHRRRNLIVLAQLCIAATILSFGGFLFFEPNISIDTSCRARYLAPCR